MTPIWVLVTALLAILLLLLLWTRSRGNDLPPGPRGLPLVGYLPWLDPHNPHYSLTKLSERYGPIYSLQMGSIFAVVIADPGLMRETLSSNAFNGRAPLSLTHGVMKGHGIICAEGDRWKDQRKFVTSNLRRFGMVKLGERRFKMEADIKVGLRDLLEKLEKTNQAVDTEHILMHFLGNVVFQLVFGRMWREDDEIWRKLIKYQEEGTKLIGIAGPINFIPLLRFLPKYKAIMEYIENGISDTHKIYQGILEDYRTTAETKNESDATHFMAAFDKEMSNRAEDPGYYTQTQFNFLMADIWGAGVDTTMSTLRWFFLYMAKYPNFQDLVQKEMDSVLGERELALSDMPSLTLLQACISETQRIRSVTPLGFPHGTLETTYVAGYRIPKGSMLIPLQWAIHMNPSFHKDPEAYMPNRFIGEDGKYCKPDAFLPFQTGKRTCLGEEYAKMLLFIFGGGVLQKFTLSLDEEVSLEGDVGITLTPKPHKIRFSERRSAEHKGNCRNLENDTSK